MAVWYFDPPYVEEGIGSTDINDGQGSGMQRWTGRWVTYFTKLRRGISVYKTGGSWYAARFLPYDEANAATWYYQGGKRAVVSDTNRTEIIAANLDNGSGGVIDSTYFTAAPDGTPLTEQPHDAYWTFPPPPPTNT